MSTEDTVRQRLREAAMDVLRPSDSWDGIERRRARGRKRLRHRRVATIAVSLVIAVVPLFLVWIAWMGSESERRQPSDENGLAEVDTGEEPVLSSVISLPADGSSIASGSEAVWVSVPASRPDADNLLVKVDPSTNSIAAEVDSAIPVYSLSLGEGSLWGIGAEQTGSQVLLRFDEVTGLVTGSLPAVKGPLATGFGSIWAVTRTSGQDSGVSKAAVVRIDPGTMQVTATIRTPGAVSDIAVDAHSVWVLVEGQNGTEDIVSIDPAADSVSVVIDADALYAQLEAGDDRVWFSSPTIEKPLFVDTLSAAVGGVDVRIVSFRPIAATYGGVWFATEGQLCLLDAIAEQVSSCMQMTFASQYPVSGTLDDTSGDVWVLTAERTLTRVDGP